MTMKQNRFGILPRKDMLRTKFNRNFQLKTTFDAGDIIPFHWDISYPGDYFTAKAKVFIRMATLLRPVMDSMYLDLHIFKVPLRLLDEKFIYMMGEQEDPGDSIDFNLQLSTEYEVQALSLSSYFGMPYNSEYTQHHVMFHRAYNFIWNEWYRAQDIQDSVYFSKLNGTNENVNGLYSVLKRNKMHDLFTSCLPTEQKGEEVTIGVGDEAPVIGDGNSLTLTDGSENFGLYYNDDDGDANSMYASTNAEDRLIGATVTGGDILTADKAIGVSSNPNKSGLIADLSEAAAITINDLRYAEAMQILLERDQRYGTRYPELVEAHFGIRPNDGRLMRPELIGGGRIRININPVVQQSQSDTTEQGNLTGLAVGYGEVKYSTSFDEHCVLLGLMSTQTNLTYQQGMDRIFTMSTRYDFYWPELSNIGEQPIYVGEVYYTGTSADDAVFGYNEAWAHLRYAKSVITGLFNSEHTRVATGETSIDQYHFAQNFTSEPDLDSDFLEEDPPMARVLAVTDEQDFYCDIAVVQDWTRPLPMYSVPGLGKHL